MTTTTIEHPTKQPNFAIVTIEGELKRDGLKLTTLAYSYETCIGFRMDWEWFLSRNYWGPTTGKHLNYLHADHDIRLDAEQFAVALADYLDTMNATKEAQP